MDPIHPIAPVPRTLPPVAPAPMIGRIDRDAPRHDPDEQRRQRRRPRSEPDRADDLGYAVDERDSDDDPGLHIDVTA